MLHSVIWFSSVFVVQPGDDVVLMAQVLEKIFMQKLSKMPSDEELITTVEPVKVKKRNTGVCVCVKDVKIL